MAWLVGVESLEVLETFELTFGREFLASVPPEDIRRLVAAVRKHHYRKGESIFHEDDIRGDIYFVASGHVKHSILSSYGQEFIHHLSPPGDFFGNLTGERRSGGTSALTDCDLLVVDRNTFLQFLSKSRQFNAFFLERHWKRAAQAVQKLHDLAFLSVPMRLANVLLEVGEADAERSGLYVPEYLNQTELAHLVGSTRESVNQCLRAFADDGWIAMEGRRVRIVDAAALHKSAGGKNDGR